MTRRAAALALASLALVLPATARAESRAQRQVLADPFKVLVVTSSQDDTSAAGVAAIQSAASSGNFSVSAPAPADVGAQFTDANLNQYKAVVFLDTGTASPLTDAQRAAFETWFYNGGGFVGVGSAIETDPSWAFLTTILGTRASGKTGVQTGTVKVADRVHDATKSLPEYWDRTDAFYNFSTNVRGVSHVLDTVVEDPFGPQPQGQTLDGIAGGTMGADHPISWCKDYKGGRSFYTGLGNTAASFDSTLTTHLQGAIRWAAGASDPVYSDCGATVLANYTETPLTRNPLLQEPIGMEQLPDGRIIQTDRRGSVRLHDPKTGTTTVLANIPVYYNNTEDGLYGPGVDNNFATDHWVYLYYAPPTVDNITFADGSTGHTLTTDPTGSAPAAAPDPSAWDQWTGYNQLSRFKFVDATADTPAHLDLSSEQQILRVSTDRGGCCHVAGDITFDKHNNLWMPTGDDSAASSGDAGGFGQNVDQKYDDTQTVRVNNATGGTFTLTLDGQTTAPLAYNATAATIQAALQSLSTIGAGNVQVTGSGTVATANQTVLFKGAFEEKNVDQLTSDSAALTGTGPAVAIATTREGGWFRAPWTDSGRSAQNTNDLRGKVLRIHVKDGDIPSSQFNKADFDGQGGAYTIPDGNLFPLVAGAPQQNTRPEIYAMGFRNPFKISVDENDVLYVSDYSPDSQLPAQFHGPAGVGRYEIVRHPANYGWPYCYSPTLPYYPWNVNLQVPMDPVTHQPIPAGQTPQPYKCDGPSLANNDWWNVHGSSSVRPGRTQNPPVTAPDIWYSYRDNNGTSPLGTPCFAYYGPDATTLPAAPGSTTPCPRLFPTLYTGGVGPHGIVKYHFDPNNHSPGRFPPYYDNKVTLGEFTQNTMRNVTLDSQNRVEEIDPFLNCTSQTTTKTPGTPFECTDPMDMEYGKDGNFYLMTYGNGFYQVNPGAGIFKFAYVKGTRAPNVVLGTDRTDGPTPLTVKFTGSNSSDDDPGDSIKFLWDFGDGTPTSTEADPTHTYTQGGRYTATLTVLDSSGLQSSKTVVITVGNTSPSVAIVAPPDGGTFAFGDKIPFSVTASDSEDGTVPCSEVHVTFVLVHDGVSQDEATTTGCSGSLPTDAADAASGNVVSGQIRVSYTDHGGPGGVPALTKTVTTALRQRHQEVEYAVNQSGTTTTAITDGSAGTARNSISSGDWVQLNGPYNLANIDSITFRVADGGAGRAAGSPLAAIEVHQDSTTGPILTTANLTSTGGTATWSSQTFPISMTGTHELFLVFRSVTGGATGGNLFTLNWAEFNGRGASVISTSTGTPVGGSVPGTLALTLGAPASFGTFTAGVANTYDATTSASVISSAGDATLSVADPSATATGHLVNGTFSLPQALTAKASSPGGTGAAFAPVGGTASPTTLLTYGGPVSNDAVTVTFEQSIASTDALRTGSYSKTLTFTLSTTTP